jgi:hypothetical protein
MSNVRDDLTLRRAAAVGRLMLGELDSWDEFQNIDDPKPANRRLRRAKASINRTNLKPEIEKFLEYNFDGMTMDILARLYENIKPPDAFRIDKDDFETHFARIKPQACPAPPHATLQISLWGLQFECPEDHLSKDIQCAFSLLREQEASLSGFTYKSDIQAKSHKKQIGKLIRKQKYACRTCILSCFSLLECYLNCIAWDFARSPEFTKLDEGQKKKLKDRGITFNDKVSFYPNWIMNVDLAQRLPHDIKHVLEVLKPFRDSIVHPSPFARPGEFGGKPKLQRLYQLDSQTAIQSIKAVINIIKACEGNRVNSAELPSWLLDLETVVKTDE